MRPEHPQYEHRGGKRPCEYSVTEVDGIVGFERCKALIEDFGAEGTTTGPHKLEEAMPELISPECGTTVPAGGPSDGQDPDDAEQLTGALGFE